MAVAGICNACQNSILSIVSMYSIQCDACNATWHNKRGGTCNDCVMGKLQQNYPNTIFCPTCNTKWYNNSLSQFGRNLKGYYSAKWKASRG